MFEVEIWISLKNSDLHVLSAWEALTHVMGITTLKRMVRYRCLRLGIEAETISEAQLTAEQFVRRSFSLFNTNKEVYRIGGGNTDAPLGRHRFRVDVSLQLPEQNGELVKRLASLAGLPVRSLGLSWVWELDIESAQDRSEIWPEVYQTIVMTQDRLKGLLMNPVYETARLLDT